MEIGSKSASTIILTKLTDISAQDIIVEDLSTRGSMFVPVIVGSDKTTLSVATGNNEYYPLYASVGNIFNNGYCAHRNGVILVGFLAIPESLFLLSIVISY